MSTLQEISQQLQKSPAFRGCCMFLSNYYAVNLKHNGHDFWSAEQMYHYMKCTDPMHRNLILCSDNKSLGENGKYVNLRPDWEEKKFDIMKEILRVKFHQGGQWLAEKLVNTGDLELIERNPWGETTWGVFNGRGKNMLGKLLMEVRAELKKEFEEGTFRSDYVGKLEEWDGIWH